MRLIHILPVVDAGRLVWRMPPRRLRLVPADSVYTFVRFRRGKVATWRFVEGWIGASA